jgi:hypothetical protein
MHLRKSWFVLAALAALAAQAAVIYKWTDADGVVHYSDQAGPGAEKIYTASAPSAGVPAAARSVAPPAPKRVIQDGLNYTEFAIASPAAEETFFGDKQVNVRLILVPGLKPNQSITWHLNGKQLDDSVNSTSFVLPRLDRGTYAIAATITDQQSGESQTCSNVTFFVRQPSELSPQHKNQ